MRTKDRKLLTKIQEFVDDFCDRNGCGPSIREIAEGVGGSLTNTHRYLTTLVSDELVAKDRRGGYVSNVLLKTETAMRSVAILGAVSCGPLTAVEECIEGYLRLPVSMVGEGKFFLLTANGESMIDAGIEDGDLVLIRQQETAEVGDIVVALVDNEVTLKRLAYNTAESRYFLHPENPNIQDIYVEQLMVQGVAVKVIKDLR